MKITDEFEAEKNRCEIYIAYYDKEEDRIQDGWTEAYGLFEAFKLCFECIFNTSNLTLSEDKKALFIAPRRYFFEKGADIEFTTQNLNAFLMASIQMTKSKFTNLEIIDFEERLNNQRKAIPNYEEFERCESNSSDTDDVPF